MSQVTTRLTNLAGPRLIQYIPPNGRHMATNEVVDIVGDLGMLLQLTNSSFLKIMTHEEAVGMISVVMNMGGRRVTGAAEPVNDSDLATRHFVLNNEGAGPAGPPGGVTSIGTFYNGSGLATHGYFSLSSGSGFNVAFSAGTILNVANFDVHNVDLTTFYNSLRVGDRIKLFDMVDPTIFGFFTITGISTGSGYFIFAVTFIGGNGTPGAGRAAGFTLAPIGNPGSNGSNGTNGSNGSNGTDGRNGSDGTNGSNGRNGSNGSDGSNGSNGNNGTDGLNGLPGGATVLLVANTSTYGGPGFAQPYNPSYASFGTMYVNQVDINNVDITNFFNSIQPGDLVRIFNRNDSSQFTIFTVASAGWNGSYNQVTVASTIVSSSGPINFGDPLGLSVSHSGLNGSNGSDGSNGTNGSDGAPGANGTNGTGGALAQGQATISGGTATISGPAFNGVAWSWYINMSTNYLVFVDSGYGIYYVYSINPLTGAVDASSTEGFVFNWAIV